MREQFVIAGIVPIGKTTLSKVAGELSGLLLADTDAIVEAVYDCPGVELVV